MSAQCVTPTTKYFLREFGFNFEAASKRYSLLKEALLNPKFIACDATPLSSNFFGFSPRYTVLSPTITKSASVPHASFISQYHGGDVANCGSSRSHANEKVTTNRIASVPKDQSNMPRGLDSDSPDGNEQALEGEINEGTAGSSQEYRAK